MIDAKCIFSTETVNHRLSDHLPKYILLEKRYRIQKINVKMNEKIMQIKNKQ